MQKLCYFTKSPKPIQWNNIWFNRKIEKELQKCEIALYPKLLFLKYIPKDAKVLDAGCGFGKWVIFLKNLGYKVIGIDESEIAITKLKEFDNSIQVELGDVLNIQYPDNFFDVYISMGVIEHFEDGPSLVLREAHRVLKPNGLVFISVPTVNIIRKVIRESFRTLLRSFLPHFNFVNFLVTIKTLNLRKKIEFCNFFEYRYTPKELQSILKQSNFEIFKTAPHDLLGSKEQSIGLVIDFPFLANKKKGDFTLNSFGKKILIICNKISLWFSCSSVLCIGRAIKNNID